MKHRKNDYSIGVVTYINRYHTYFKHNIEKLASTFPEKRIICIINGHPDKTRHLAYLKEVTSFLSGFGNIKYVTFEDHQSLSKCWNWILLMSHTENNLILNDDIQVQTQFKEDFEKHLAENSQFFAINGSFSHFLIAKSVVHHIGWFDERFLGVGQEDGDYLIRLARGGVGLLSASCRDILNFVAPNHDPSFKKISSSAGNKYADVNREFMRKKWLFNHFGDEHKQWDVDFTWNNETWRATLKDGMETPLFYDYSLLDNNQEFAQKTKDIGSTLHDSARRIKSAIYKNLS